MNTIKAICECKDFSEDDLVLAVKRTRFQWLTEWGVFKVLLTGFLILVTVGIWLVVVLSWKLDEIIRPDYNCQFCDQILDKKQVRSCPDRETPTARPVTSLGLTT